jgi:DNA-binding NarL/FixJ family response regulator
VNTALAQCERAHAAQPDERRDIVLLVDDTPANLAYLSDALHEAGYKVLVAIDGATAIERLQHVTPDIILLDAVMPGMDGFQTCRTIKGIAAARDIPIVFMTALIESEHIVRAFNEGAIDYVTKPVRQDEALARIRTHIARARTLQKAQRSIEVCGKAGLTVDASGSITWQTPRARDWLNEYCGSADNPRWDRVRTWLRELSARRASPSDASTPLTLTQESGRLSIYYASDLHGGERLLLLEEHRDDVSARRLAEGLGLTTRESEVLSWLAAGKTNRDIGEILGMSPRTVNKHLEHIYVKLGVETRSAAAAIAFRLPYREG